MAHEPRLLQPTEKGNFIRLDFLTISQNFQIHVSSLIPNVASVHCISHIPHLPRIFFHVIHSSRTTPHNLLLQISMYLHLQPVHAGSRTVLESATIQRSEYL